MSRIVRRRDLLVLAIVARTATLRRRLASRMLLATCLLAGSIGLLGIATTSALLSDEVTSGSVVVSAGSVGPVSGLTLADTGTALHLAWSAPPGGITPQDYEVQRRPATGSYGGVPLATPPTVSWDDATATECTTWTYRVRARHTNLRGGWSGESSLLVDRTPPAVSDAHLYWASSTPKVADFVRVNPGGSVEVYAELADNCASAASLDVSFAFGAPFNATVVPTFSSGGWTPIGGGPTYHWRFDYPLPGYAVANDQAVTWNVIATDPSGNQSTTPGTTFRGDGAGPVFQDAQMVSAYTNFFAASVGHGEIPSDGTARASGSYVYADFTDASGVASVTVDLTTGNIRYGSTALPLDPGSYTTWGSPTAWPWRSDATVIRTGLGNGTRYFTVTAVDAVGNAATTSPSRPVEIDDDGATSGTTSCSNFGNDNSQLDAGDGTDVDFGDAIWPESIRSGWTGAPLTATATLIDDGTSDYLDWNGDFGVSLLRGSTTGTAWSLNAKNWVTSDTAFPGSTFRLQDPTTLRVTYQGASITYRNKTSQGRIGTTLRDAAGNVIASGFNESCDVTAW